MHADNLLAQFSECWVFSRASTNLHHFLSKSHTFSKGESRFFSVDSDTTIDELDCRAGKTTLRYAFSEHGRRQPSLLGRRNPRHILPKANLRQLD